MVQAGGDYAVNFVDPDVIVDWELIEQVVRAVCCQPQKFSGTSAKFSGTNAPVCHIMQPCYQGKHY